MTFKEQWQLMGLLYLVCLSMVGTGCEVWLYCKDDPVYRWWVLAVSVPVLVVAFPMLMRFGRVKHER